MAGKPDTARRMALLRECDADILELMEQGESMRRIAVRITDKLEEPISEAMIGRWCQEAGNEERCARARERAANHKAESVVDRAEDLARDVKLGVAGKEDIAAERHLAEQQRWIAGVWNKRYAAQTGAQVQINVGAIHLNALRAAPAVVAERPAHLALFDKDQADDVEYVEQPVSKADLF